MAGLPRDPAMLLSVLNMKLRDRYASLDQLCEDLDEDREQLLAVMEAAGCRYDPQLNAFVCQE